MSDSNDHNSFPAVAVVLIIATGIALAGMDALAKFLALQVPIIMVLWGRYFFHTVITLAPTASKLDRYSFCARVGLGCSLFALVPCLAPPSLCTKPLPACHWAMRLLSSF